MFISDVTEMLLSCVFSFHSPFQNAFIFVIQLRFSTDVGPFRWRFYVFQICWNYFCQHLEGFRYHYWGSRKTGPNNHAYFEIREVSHNVILTQKHISHLTSITASTRLMYAFLYPLGSTLHRLRAEVYKRFLSRAIFSQVYISFFLTPV